MEFISLDNLRIADCTCTPAPPKAYRRDSRGKPIENGARHIDYYREEYTGCRLMVWDREHIVNLCARIERSENLVLCGGLEHAEIGPDWRIGGRTGTVSDDDEGKR